MYFNRKAALPMYFNRKATLPMHFNRLFNRQGAINPS
jgi:hypothetical protein